jgi:hypothetical protein
LDEVNRRRCPNVGECFQTTGKKVSSFFMGLLAFMVVVAAATNLLPELPGKEKPKLSEGYGDLNKRNR